MLFYLKCIVYSDFFGFYLISFFFFCVPWSHPRLQFIFTCHNSLCSSYLWQFLRLSLLLMALIVFHSIGQVFCRMLLYYNLSNGFLISLELVMVFWEKDHKEKVTCLSHYIKDICYHQCFPLLIIIQ